MSEIVITKTTIEEPMKIIRVFLNWNHAEKARKNIEYEFNLWSIPGYKKTFDLTSGEDYTHVIIINTAMPELCMPKKNVIGLAWEPNQLLQITPKFIEYAKTHIHRYLIGQCDKGSSPFEEGYAFLNHNPMQIHIPFKTKRCSMIFSNKSFMEGHLYRRSLVEAILKTKLPVDIWGSGCNSLSNMKDERIKGEFLQNSVVPYEDYEFHICIENTSLNHYFSEKIVNALLSECTPIYLGCRNIDDYFPEQVIHLQGNIEKDLAIIYECLENPVLYKKHVEKEKIDKIVNPFFHLDKLFG